MKTLLISTPFMIFLIAYIGYRIGWKKATHNARLQRARDEPVILAARDCAGKLRVEMIRGTVERRAEYENLVDECAGYRWL